jgi:hypothetical protein
MKLITKTAAIVAGSALVVLASASAAGAGQPAVRGCVGSSISAAAHAINPYGQFVEQFAQDPQSHPGVSDDVHTLAAGGYTDAQFPNTCN